MEIRYEVDDGYCGGSRPQIVDVDDDELSQCETTQQKKEYIEKEVQEHFEQTITWYINDYGDLDC